MDRNQASQLTTGLILVAIGLIFLGQRLDVTPAFDMGRLWPVILIVLGIGRFLAPREDGRQRSGLWLVFLGGLFLMHTYRMMTLDRSWPLFIVAGGVSILLGSRCRPAETKTTVEGR